MFKKLTGALLITLGLVGSLFLGVEETNAKAPVRVKEEVVVIPSNVGDGQEYAYVITDINEVEIHGVPLNKESKTNRGIFLYKEEVDFEVKLGDKIVVVWGEEEDEFKLIDRAVVNHNGEYISKTKAENDSYNKEYAYQITEIKGNEIHGVAINNIGDDNGGILLYEEEVSFDVKVGDKIVVIWGEQEDEFELIDRAVETKKGEYISETKLSITLLLEKLRSKKF